ncbi:MAG: lysylphosphatidylglycerol synthase transmembrane domain-containing protein [Acidobacteriaceae bacterium]|nr:lysylphosphatidylglycerol synthase transmembrane domain-containing protein [Acidobacteriaceae bacterium]
MKKAARNVLAVLLVVLLVAGIWWAHSHVYFDWNNLKLQVRTADWSLIALAVAANYLCISLRSWRWRLLMGGSHATRSYQLIGSQFIGFTVVALFGRVADLARPYLVARRTQTPVATQLAVYSIERAYDLAAAAILFSLTLAFVPRTMPHHEAFARAGMISLGATAFLALFAIAVRFSGGALAGIARGVFRIVSEEFANSAATKILDFREGLKTIATAGQFFGALGWSLLIWSLIAFSYFESARAFVNTTELTTFTVPQTMLLMATSMGGSLLQLPVLGWFTQIGVLAVALHGFFGVPAEVASACGAVMLVVTTLGIVPGGLILAKIEGVSLRDAARRSEEQVDELLSEEKVPSEIE